METKPIETPVLAEESKEEPVEKTEPESKDRAMLNPEDEIDIAPVLALTNPKKDWDQKKS